MRQMLKWTVLIGLAACNPPPPPPDLILTLGCSILQPDLRSTLREADALIDGQVVAQESSVATAALLPTGQKLDVAEGSVHTVECRIGSQTVSPTVYEIDATISVDGPESTRETDLGSTTKSFATGQGVSFSVTVNP